MSRISLGGGRSVSIRDYATGLSRTGHPAGALRYAQGKDDIRKRDEEQRAEREEQLRARFAEARKATDSRLDNVGPHE